MANRKIKKLYELLVKAGIPCEIIGNALLVNSDCRRVLKLLPPNIIDSCGTDGPYGINHFGKDWDNFNPQAVTKGTRRKGGAGLSPTMFSGKYDKSRSGAIRFQHFSYEWAKEVWRILKPGAFLISFCSPKNYHRMATGIQDAGFEIIDMLQWLCSQGHPYSHNAGMLIDKFLGAEREIVGPNPNRKGRRNWDHNQKNITLPATKEAKTYEGWGTRLRQSNEPIALARKPLGESNIAKNLFKYGTGIINTEACKFGEKRRFPTNTIISEEVADILGDKAKFFYCPKVSRKERNAGCEHLVAKLQNSEGKGRTYNDRCATCGKKFIGSEQTRCNCPKGLKKTDKSVYKNKNHHPTVKPIALMEYLVKLITPVTPKKDSICLDMFMGSGSTGISCSNLGIGFIGVEREKEYFEIAKARIQYWSNLRKVA